MKYLIYGLGIANKAVQTYFDLHHIDYIIYDDKSNDENILLDQSIDVVVKSPGIKNDTKMMQYLINQKVKIITDLELFAEIKKDKFIIAVTGSNGKTTTCHILGSILKETDQFIEVGNMGIPIFSKLQNEYPGYVIECSSYMLEYTHTFKPNIFIFLNIENHHQSSHKTFSNYLEAKLKPLKNMDQNDYLIYNLDDRVLVKTLNNYNVKKYTFSLYNNNATCYYQNGIIWLNHEPYIKTKYLTLQEEHNIMNIMAAILAVKVRHNGSNIIDEKIKKMLINVKGLPHRLETVKSDRNKIIINDSKATNVFATIKAFKEMQRKYPNFELLWLAGGKSEEQDFTILNDYLPKNTKIFLYGENQELIKNSLNFNCQLFPNLNDAILAIKEIFSNMMILLFSPASSSFDEFKNFEERGEYFKNLCLEYLK